MDNKIQIADLRKWEVKFSESDSGHTLSDVTFTEPNGSSCSQQWKRIKALAQGGYGTVYQEECIKSTPRGVFDKVRAVKRLKQIHTKKGPEHLEELGLIFKFSKEMPEYFVVAHGWYEDLEDIYISMELLQYGSLKDRLKNGGKLRNDDCQQITLQVLYGLSWLYEEGVIHGDIKPANILIGSRGPQWKVKISDFGISRRLRILHDKAPPEAFTEEYAAPEILFENMRLTERQTDLQYAADMWSLGVVLLELFTGVSVFKGKGSYEDEARHHIGEFCNGNVKRVDDLIKKDSNLDVEGLELIWDLLTVNPKQRCTVTNAVKHDYFTMLKIMNPRFKQRAPASVNSPVSEPSLPASKAKKGKSTSTKSDSKRSAGSSRAPAQILHSGSPSVLVEHAENEQPQVPASVSQWKHEFFNYFQHQYWFEVDEDGSVLLPPQQTKTPAVLDAETQVQDFPKGFRSGYSPSTSMIVSKSGDNLKNSANGQKRFANGGVYDNTSNYLYREGYFKTSVFIPGTTNELFGFEGQSLRIYNLQSGRSLDKSKVCLGTIITATLLDDKVVVVSVRDVKEGDTEVTRQVFDFYNLDLEEADSWQYCLADQDRGHLDRRYTLSPDATYLAVHGPDRVSFFDLKKGNLLWHAQDTETTSYCFTNDCRKLITASRSACCVYDMDKMKVTIFDSIKSTDIWISSDDRFLVFNARDFGAEFYYTGKVLWDWHDGAPPPKADDQQQAISAFRKEWPNIERLLAQLAVESKRTAAS